MKSKLEKFSIGIEIKKGHKWKVNSSEIAFNVDSFPSKLLSVGTC